MKAYTLNAKKEIKTEILIQASPQKVWEVLTDFEQYSAWNHFIKSIKGPAQVGQTITVRIEPPQASGMTMKPTVLVFEDGREFRWQGNLGIKGLFDGEHVFELLEQANNSTLLVHKEGFSGILVPLFKKLLEVNTLNGFHLMNQSLKRRAEEI